MRSRRHETFGFQTAIADRAPLGASPRVDHYCLPVRESQFALVPPGVCSRSVVGGDGASTLVRGHPGAQSGIAVPRARFASRVPRVVRRFCGVFWTIVPGAASRGPARVRRYVNIVRTCEDVGINVL